MAFDIKVARKEQNKIDLNRRKTTFEEIVVPFQKEDILEQTKRCLSCPNPKCEEGCPLHLPIRDMIKLISQGKEEEAFQLINNVSPFNGICAIVCDHAAQCEGHCVRGIKDKPVNIGAIHRYTAFLDYEFKMDKKSDNDKKVAIIGAGPSGLSCAFELRKEGYQVTIYERENHVGGVAYYGIPNFRFKLEDLSKISKKCSDFGVNLQLNQEIKLFDIIDQYDAIYVAIGTQKSKYMRIPGEDLKGIFTSEEFLKDIKINHNIDKYNEYHSAIVIGGGNVAMDVSRTLIRLGKDTTIVYRRSIEEAPARKDEIEEAKEEGIKFSFLNNPVMFLGSDKLEKIKIIKMELGEPDASGRRRPVEIPNSEYDLKADMVVLAIGQEIEKQYLDNIELNWGTIKINENYQTNIEKVFAGGDAVTGSKTVVHAIKEGINASKSIISFLNK